MARKQPVVRAIDVGYGHVKFTDGFDEDGELKAESFPSQSAIVQGTDLKSEILQARDTFLIPINGRNFEVGRAVRNAINGREETEVLDKRFSLSEEYQARLFGAINYMMPSLPDRTIDLLVLGLPLTTFSTFGPELSQRFLGKHVINSRGDEVTIERCNVLPQPLGSYAAYLHDPLPHHTSAPTALVVDPGYNTVDWFVCEGMVPNKEQSGAVERGMSAVLRAIAKSVIESTGQSANESAVVRLVDKGMLEGSEIRLKGKSIDLQPHLRAGQAVIQQAMHAMYKSVGEGDTIDIILVTGGGGSLYEPFIRQAYPHHEVLVLKESALANVRGFHYIGEQLSASAHRSLQKQEREVASV